MILSEWPAMMLVTAERIASGDVIYGVRKEFKIELFDEPWLVMDVGSSGPGGLRIDGHDQHGVIGFVLCDIHQHVLIEKKKEGS